MNSINILKQLIVGGIRRVGYDLHKRSPLLELALYEEFFHQNSIANKRFYNIGAGDFSHPYWTNVDYDNDFYKQNRRNTLNGIQHDLFEEHPLPIPNEVAEIVYTSHTIEHITDAAAGRLFGEIARILKPGGIFRIAAPDAELAYQAYSRGDRHFFTWIKDYSRSEVMKRMALSSRHDLASLEQIFIYHIVSSASELHADSPCRKITDKEFIDVTKNSGFEDIMNYLVGRGSMEVQRRYAGNHINWWSHSKLMRMLNAAGFARVHHSEYLQSVSPVLRNKTLFDSTVPSVSLYIECYK